MIELNHTHDPAAHSWLSSANVEGCDFPIQNLPYAVFRKRDANEAFRGGVAIGDMIRASPDNGRNAALRPTSARSVRRSSRAIRTRIAAPAECPTATTGRAPSTASNAPIDAAMPSSESPCHGGVDVRAWPGRSGAMTRKSRASNGASARNE